MDDRDDVDDLVDHLRKTTKVKDRKVSRKTSSLHQLTASALRSTHAVRSSAYAWQDARQQLSNWLESSEGAFFGERAERANEAGRWGTLCEEIIKAAKAGVLERAGKQWKTESLEFLAVLKKFLNSAEKYPRRVGERSLKADGSSKPFHVPHCVVLAPSQRASSLLRATSSSFS